MNDKNDKNHLPSAPELQIPPSTSKWLCNGMIAKSHEQQEIHRHNNNPHEKNTLHEFLNNNILYINVGGQIFTTTKNTMKKCALFNKLLEEKKHSDSSEIQYLEDVPQSELVKRQTTFENYCVEHLENKNEEHTKIEKNNNNNNNHNNELIADIKIPDGIYQINSNYYFVDRSPLYFDDILHFLRNYNIINPQEFIDKYYNINNYSHQYTLFELNSNHSNNSIQSSFTHSNPFSINNNINKLLRLQDEARFYQINSLINAIQDKLDDENRININNNINNTANHNATNNIWWDQTGPLNGLRRIPGTRICFATSKDNWVDKNTIFEIPNGFKWATQSEYLDEYFSKRILLQTYKEWIHFGIGNWDNYRWKYARKVAFIFKDTFKGQRFVHSGMEVCDINHVKSLCGLMAESPLMEYDESKGIIEGFAGLVLLSQQICNKNNNKNKNKNKSKNKNKNKTKTKTNQNENENENIIKQSPPSTTSTWTSDEDDEQIQSLKKKTNNNNNNKQTLLPINNNNNINNKAPIPSYPNLPPPQLANTFAEYTKKQRAILTKNNLDKHTQIEHAKHVQQQHHTQQHTQQQQQQQHAQITQQLTIQHQQQQQQLTIQQQQQQQQRQQQQYIHQSPQYIHHQFNPNGHFHYGQLPLVPAPQLTPRLSVNSLPVPTTNHSLIHQTQKHK